MGTLTAAAVKDRYTKLAWYNTSDKKLYKTTEDGTDSDTAITDLTLTGELTVGSESSLYSLTIKRYGSSLAGDSNPFTISHELGDGAHDLTLFGNTSDTLHLRMLDGDIKLGASTTPTTLLTNAGAATIGTTLTVGTIAEVGSDTDKFLMSDSGVFKYATGSNVRSYIGAGTSSVAALNDLSDVTYSSGDLTISSLDKIVSGSLEFDSSGHIKFDGCAAGFTRHEETFSVTDLKSTGGTDDTDIDFRVSNKIRLEMTGDIAQMNLVFPAVSGNFILVTSTNGDHDVTAWKVWESDLSAATTTDVMWAGGSVPAFTSSGVDISSFYWDATEQQCYGVCSLAFATP